MGLGMSWGGRPLDQLAHELCTALISVLADLCRNRCHCLGVPWPPFLHVFFFFAGTWHQESKVGMSTGLWVTDLALTASDSDMVRVQGALCWDMARWLGVSPGSLVPGLKVPGSCR